MIAVYGRGDDEPVTRVLAAAERLGVEVALLDQRRLATAELPGTPSGPLDEVTGVYVRPLGLPPDAPAEDRRRHDAVLDWLEATGAQVASRPSAMESNDSKPYQAQLVAAAGFAIPETLISSDPDEVLAFRARHGRIVFKSISGVRSVVRCLDDRAARRLPLLRDLPVQFQAFVPGADVRVHVVGDDVLATEIRSDAVDYRYARRDGLAAELRAVTLPAASVARCRHLARALDLPFCGIDLRRRPDGTEVCFEVNPMPGFSYYEHATGAPIAETLVRMLDRTDRTTRAAAAP